MQSGEVVRLEIPKSTRYVCVVRRAVEGMARRMDFNADDIEDVKLAVGEACTNAVRHSAEPTERISIRCQVSARGLEIQIKNTINSGISAPPVTPLPNPRDMNEGGLGLYLMRQLMDEVELLWEGEQATVNMLKRPHNTTVSPEL